MSLKKVQRAARLAHEHLDNNEKSVEAVALWDNDHPVGLKAEELDVVAKVKELLAAYPSMGYRRLYDHLKQETANASLVKKQREFYLVGADTAAGEMLEEQYGILGMQCCHEVDDEQCDDADNAGLIDTMKDFYEYSTDADSDTDDSNMDCERLLDSDEAASTTNSLAPVPNVALRPSIPIQNMNIGICQKSKVEDWKVRQGLVPRPAAEQFAIHTPRTDQSFDIFTPRPAV